MEIRTVPSGRKKIVVLGMMTKMPFARVVWQTMHYLIGFERLDDILAALDDIQSDYKRHSRAAREIARNYFSHDVVLPRILQEVGLE